jgi:cell fate (sporulation/competence/biofilm development) regulator YmcA (YheA/YmcA/DUF963 family)
MKINPLLYAALFFVFIPLKVLSQSYSPHDSLIFDGSNTTYKTGEDCDLIVKMLKGTARGMKMVRKISTICGEKDTVKKYIFGPLILGDKIKPGETIETASDGFVGIGLDFIDQPGSITMSSSSVIKITQDVCKDIKNIPGAIIEVLKFIGEGGKVYIEMEKGSKYNEVIKQIPVINSLVSFKGTKFSIENTTENGEKTDIIKAYDGTVEIQFINRSQQYEEAGQKMVELGNKMQEGKITVQEYLTKVEDYNKLIAGLVPVKIEPGNMCMVTSTTITVAPISSDDNPWWETAFK